MRKLFVLAALVGIGLLAWRSFGPESGARKAYAEFARAWAFGNYESARDLTLEGSPARKMVDDRLDLRKKGGFPGATFSINALSHSILAETASDGGTAVTLKVQQTIRVSGMGEESAFGRPAYDEQDVVMRASGAAWKVASFDERPL
jgi:hypothetical protein